MTNNPLERELAAELATLHSLPHVMRILRTANSMLAGPIGHEDDEARRLALEAIVYEVYNTLGLLQAGTLEAEQPRSS
jgi:hypothetical protein